MGLGTTASSHLVDKSPGTRPGLFPHGTAPAQGYLIWTPETARLMTRRWISEVPSKIV
jgi:hypothetical protein